MDLMIQFSDDFRRQLLADGRSVPVSRPITAKVATERFRVTGLNAAVRKFGDVMPTARTAEIMAINVNQRGQRDFQKITNTRATHTSMNPKDAMAASKRELGIPAACSMVSSSGLRQITFGTNP